MRELVQNVELHPGPQLAVKTIFLQFRRFSVDAKSPYLLGRLLRKMEHLGSFTLVMPTTLILKALPPTIRALHLPLLNSDLDTMADFIDGGNEKTSPWPELRDLKVWSPAWANRNSERAGIFSQGALAMLAY